MAEGVSIETNVLIEAAYYEQQVLQTFILQQCWEPLGHGR